MTLGRIPWSKARAYARELGFEPGMLDHFWRIVTALDTGFLEWMKAEHDRYVRINKPKGSKVGGRSTSRRTYNS